MNINLQPAISVALMSGLGYLTGASLKINAKEVALIWMISEVARQVFLHLNNYFGWGFSTESSFSITAAIGNIPHGNQTELVYNSAKSILYVLSLACSLVLVEELSMRHLRIAYWFAA